jgi:hypothetical protein
VLLQESKERGREELISALLACWGALEDTEMNNV